MVRRRPGEAYKPQCLAPTVIFGGGSVVIWGCFIKAGIRQICLCEGCMNQAKYKVVLGENLLPSTLTMFPNSEEWSFQQDNAPCHTATLTQTHTQTHVHLPGTIPAFAVMTAEHISLGQTTSLTHKTMRAFIMHCSIRWWIHYTVGQ